MTEFKRTNINFEDFDPKAFIKDVRSFMVTNKISIRKFAKLARISPASLTRIESGENDITVGMGAKMQKVMRTFKPSA